MQKHHGKFLSEPSVKVIVSSLLADCDDAISHRLTNISVKKGIIIALALLNIGSLVLSVFEHLSCFNTCVTCRKLEVVYK